MTSPWSRLGVVLGLLSVAGCLGSPSETTGPPTSGGSTATPHGSGHTQGGNASMTEVYIVGTDVGADPESSWRLYPGTVSGKKEQVQNWTFKSATGNQDRHTLNIDELGLHIPAVAPGHTASAVMTLSKTGTFTFYCSIGVHRSLGMEGTLTVA